VPRSVDAPRGAEANSRRPTVMQADQPVTTHGVELTDRERRVLEAVVRTYVETAEPAGSRTVSKRSTLGVSPATIRNTMSDLEEKGYLTHPHTSAGRVPTDRAYRFFVDRIIQPAPLTVEEQMKVAEELEGASPALERLVRRAAGALSLLSLEMGLAVAPRLDEAVLEKLDLVQVSSDKVVLVANIHSGILRTVYVDLRTEVPRDALVTLSMILNERLAGTTLGEIRETLPDRLRDVSPEDESTEELLNIFLESGSELFDWPGVGSADVALGRASMLASQPEFTDGERLKGLIEPDHHRGRKRARGAERLHPRHRRISCRGVEGRHRRHRPHSHGIREGHHHRGLHLRPGEPTAHVLTGQTGEHGRLLRAPGRVPGRGAGRDQASVSQARPGGPQRSRATQRV